MKAASKKEKATKKKSSRLGSKTGENAEANVPQFAPITGDSEENHVSDAIPKEDGEKKPTPNPGINIGPGGWFSKTALGNADAARMFSFIAPPEGSPSVPVKDSQRSPAIRPSSPSPSFRK
jgi:hypothetical protein